MKKVEVRFEENDLALLDRQAQERGLTRAELIRKRTLSTVAARRFTPQDFSQLVSDAYRQNHGSIGRKQVEAIAAFVFSRVVGDAANPSEASPSLPST